jgi:hypothetical protein
MSKQEETKTVPITLTRAYWDEVLRKGSHQFLNVDVPKEEDLQKIVVCALEAVFGPQKPLRQAIPYKP